MQMQMQNIAMLLRKSCLHLFLLYFTLFLANYKYTRKPTNALPDV